mmetsp:Transcript_23232/g.71192  ORF Transcript_23232/g.71192 Transcript_23232/m.71192 type:complete len:256 (+) Transcript_23232:475-1242(+)
MRVDGPIADVIGDAGEAVNKSRPPQGPAAGAARHPPRVVEAKVVAKLVRKGPVVVPCAREVDGEAGETHPALAAPPEPLAPSQVYGAEVELGALQPHERLDLLEGPGVHREPILSPPHPSDHRVVRAVVREVLLEAHGRRDGGAELEASERVVPEPVVVVLDGVLDVALDVALVRRLDEVHVEGLCALRLGVVNGADRDDEHALLTDAVLLHHARAGRVERAPSRSERLVPQQHKLLLLEDDSFDSDPCGTELRL